MNQTWIALLRGIGPATHKLMSMAQLREACEAATFGNVRTVLATGNVLFSTSATPQQIQRTLDDIVAAHHLNNAVFLRRPEELGAVLRANPFPDAASERPNHMLVLFMATEPAADAIAALGALGGPERITVEGREAYIDYIEGVGQSKLTPARLERALGQSGTARNWNTVQRLVRETGANP